MFVRLFSTIEDYKWFIVFVISSFFFIPFSEHITYYDIEKPFDILALANLLNISVEIKNIWLKLLNYILLFTIASLFYVFLNRIGLVERKNYVGLLFSIFFMALFLNNVFSIKSIIITVLLLFAIANIAKAETQKEKEYLRYFDASFLVGVATLFDFSLVFFVIILFWSIFIFRLYEWRKPVVIIIGLVLPHLYVICWYMLKYASLDILQIYRNIFKTSFFSIEPFVGFPILWISYALIVFLSMIKVVSELSEKRIQIRRNSWFLISTLLILMLALIVTSSNKSSILFLMFLISGWLVGVATKELNNKKVFAIVIDVCVISLIIWHLVLPTKILNINFSNNKKVEYKENQKN